MLNNTHKYNSTHYTVISLLLLLLLSGCASQTAYQPANGSGYGYQESQIADNRYRVAFKMRGEQPLAAMDYALLRAAELTLMAGYDWFIVVDRHTLSNREQRGTTAYTGVQRDRVVTQECGLLGCTTRSYPTTQRTVGVGVEAGERSEVEVILEIRLGKGVRPSEGDSYDALEVRNRLRQQHQA